MRSAIFKPTVPSAAWPAVLPNSSENNKKECPMPSNQPAINNRQRSIQEFSMTRTAEDEYGIEAINDSDILRLAEQAEQDDNNEDDHIDDPQPGQEQHCKYYIGVEPPTATARMPYLNERQQARLPNGRYKCRHLCKDKTKCKHLCCREGLDEPPKVGKKGRKDNLNVRRWKQPTDVMVRN
jgi:ATP-dependent DNA helicase HFM1/MER3